MKPRGTLIQLKRFEVEVKRRKVAEIEAMINELDSMAADLDRQIAIEQDRAGVEDVNHYAYPTFAKAAIQRRNNLKASAANLELKLSGAREQLAETFEELKKIEHGQLTAMPRSGSSPLTTARPAARGCGGSC